MFTDSIPHWFMEEKVMQKLVRVYVVVLEKKKKQIKQFT
jgi:hypothetical protein